MAGRQPPTRAFSLVELLVAMFIIGILVALVLPAVQQSRESARRTGCQNNLKQMGLALQQYEGTYGGYPPGFIGEHPDPTIGKGWGWSVFVLPFLEHAPLYENLSVDRLSLDRVVADPSLRPHLQHRITVYLCPSDSAGELAHAYRNLTGQQLPPWFMPFHPPPPSFTAVQVASSNYVGVFGDAWHPRSGVWTIAKLRGNGILGCNTHIQPRDVTDGLSHTLAVGERSWESYAAVWAGVESWSECTTHGVSMVLGTAYYPLNDEPQPYYLSCDGRGAAGFGSRHPGGAQFLFCDGSVHFLSDTIEFRNATNPSQLGAFQKLARRHDGQPIPEY